MIRALITGKLHDTPQSRTSATGNTFAIAKVKADDKGGAWVWVSVIAFGAEAERLLEVKRAATPRLADWWQQTCAQAQATGQRPALAYRLDRQPWRVVLALRHVAAGFENAPLSLRLETNIEVFVALVRALAA